MDKRNEYDKAVTEANKIKAKAAGINMDNDEEVMLADFVFRKMEGEVAKNLVYRFTDLNVAIDPEIESEYMRGQVELICFALDIPTLGVNKFTVAKVLYKIGDSLAMESSSNITFQEFVESQIA